MWFGGALTLRSKYLICIEIAQHVRRKTVLGYTSRLSRLQILEQEHSFQHLEYRSLKMTMGLIMQTQERHGVNKY
jgi:hypothetical protein